MGQEKAINNIHDRSYKDLYSNKVVFLNLIKEMLNASWAKELREKEILKHWLRSTVDETIRENVVKILEANKEGVENMVANNAFMIKEMKEKVEKETRKQDRIEIAKNLLDTLDDEVISLKVGLTINEVKKLRADSDSKAYN
jgi:hypothetical protein